MLTLKNDNEQFQTQYSVRYTDWDILRSNGDYLRFNMICVKYNLIFFDKNHFPDCMVFNTSPFSSSLCADRMFYIKSKLHHCHLAHDVKCVHSDQLHPNNHNSIVMLFTILMQVSDCFCVPYTVAKNGCVE